MRILLPTGEKTFEMVTAAAAGYNADVVVTGEIASFLTPVKLRSLLEAAEYDIAIVPGMCTASFRDVEQDTGVRIIRGPRHAADLPLVLPLIGTEELSAEVPADEFLTTRREEEAKEKLIRAEESASFDLMIGDLKIGGYSRMKVLAEIMDAHTCEDLFGEVQRFTRSGADIIDLGFGFDATPRDVERCLEEIGSFRGVLAIDTQDPDLIRAALGRVDLILSLHEGNIPEIGREIANTGTAAVVVPRKSTLEENISQAEKSGISRIIADPLLQPVGSGLVVSLKGFKKGKYPVFFGAGNVTELIDADSVGINALLAGIAQECGAAIIFTSEHSDKTRGSVGEMRRAVEMMALTGDRPYPKDLGIDLFVIKEKRRRREPALVYSESKAAESMPDMMEYDPMGMVRIGIEDGVIVAVHDGIAFYGDRWEDVFHSLMREGRVSLLDHAAYLGKELYKAELALRFGRSFDQDGIF